MRATRFMFATLLGGCLATSVMTTGVVSEAKSKSAWDGVWAGAWGGQVATKVVIKNGNVVEYDYYGTKQSGLGKTIDSGSTLTFGTPPFFGITMSKTSDTTAVAHYHGQAARQTLRSQGSKRVAKPAGASPSECGYD